MLGFSAITTAGTRWSWASFWHFFPANFAANHHLTTFHIPTWRKPKEIMIAPPPCPLHQTATFPHPAREKNTKNNPELGSENSKLWDGWRVPTQEENKCSADHQAGHHRKGKWRFVTCCIYVMCSDFYHFHLIPILISYFQLWLFGFCSQGIIIFFTIVVGLNKWIIHHHIKPLLCLLHHIYNYWQVIVFSHSGWYSVQGGANSP